MGYSLNRQPLLGLPFVDPFEEALRSMLGVGVGAASATMSAIRWTFGLRWTHLWGRGSRP